MDIMVQWGIFLLIVCLVIVALTILCLVLGKIGYKLHISKNKIEILPTKESPTKRQ